MRVNRDRSGKVRGALGLFSVAGVIAGVGVFVLTGCKQDPLDQISQIREAYFEDLEGVFPCVEYVDGWYGVMDDPEDPFKNPEFPAPSSQWDDALGFYHCMHAQAAEALSSLERFSPESMPQDEANEGLHRIRDQIVALFQVGNLFSKQWQVCSRSRYAAAECEAVNEVLHDLWYRIDNVYDEVWPLTDINHHYLRSNLREAKDGMVLYVRELEDAIAFFQWRMEDSFDWGMGPKAYQSALCRKPVEWPECLELLDRSEIDSMNLQPGVQVSPDGEISVFKRRRNYQGGDSNDKGGISFVVSDGDHAQMIECMRGYTEWLASVLANHNSDGMSVNDEKEKYEDLRMLSNEVFDLQNAWYKHWDKNAKENLARGEYTALERLLAEHDDALGDCIQFASMRQRDLMLERVLVYQAKAALLLFQLKVK